MTGINDWFTEDEEMEFCKQICDKLGQGLPKYALLEQGLIDYCGCEDDINDEYDEYCDEYDEYCDEYDEY